MSSSFAVTSQFFRASQKRVYKKVVVVVVVVTLKWNQPCLKPSLVYFGGIVITVMCKSSLTVGLLANSAD